MGIIKLDDVIAWEENGEILCDDCAKDRAEAMPQTSNDIADEDIVICDGCQKRIQ